MSLPLLLLGAKTGVDILGAVSGYNAAKGQAALDTAASEINQFQLERAGRLAAEQRSRDFADAIGTQRAQVASAGVMGGRTARLLEAEAQTAFDRMMQEDEMATRFGVAREETTRNLLRAGTKAARSQLGINLLGIGLDAGFQGARYAEAKKAGD